MNIQITDREAQALKAALESQRSRKQAVIEAAPASVAADMKKTHLYKEIRQPDNEYDILSTEHTLMHTISMLAKITGLPVAHFMNPNPSQDTPKATHEPEEQHPKSNP